LEEYGIDAEDYLAHVHGFSVEGLLAPNTELNAALAQLPLRKVIFTNSTAPHTQQVLATLGIAEHFERIFDIKETGYVGKPDPAAYHLVLNALGVGPEQCIAIDDSVPNLRTAAELGMVTVLVGSAERVDGVDWAIARIEGIAEVAHRLSRMVEESGKSGFLQCREEGKSHVSNKKVRDHA
jgi:putative hydrolase of the HAD superfamily